LHETINLNYHANIIIIFIPAYYFTKNLGGTFPEKRIL